MILWLYILGITIAEITTALLNPQWGIVMHGFLLVGLLISSFISREEASYKIYLSMTPAPLIRMISLGLPLLTFPKSIGMSSLVLPCFWQHHQYFES